MKPAKFDYYAPATVDEALEQLAQLGYDGKVLAGGQSLIPAMNFRLAQPAALVDLNNIPQLFYIREKNDGGAVIGTMTRDSKVEIDPIIAKRFPLINEMMPHVAHAQNRNRGTFGGNIAHADPTGHIPGLIMALKADLVIKKRGEADRRVAVDDFFIGPFMTAIEPGEMLAEIDLPPMPARTGASYEQMSRQHGTAALAGVISVITLDQKTQCQDARLVIMSVEGLPVLGVEAAKILKGQTGSEALFEEAAEALANVDVVDAASDIHATAEFRRHLVRTLAVRSLEKSFQRAKGG